MKVNLTPEATASLKSLTDKLRERGVRKSYSAIVNALLIHSGELKGAGLTQLSDTLITPQDKYKALLKQAAAMSEKVNEKSLHTLEKSMKKFRQLIEMSTKNEA